MTRALIAVAGHSLRYPHGFTEHFSYPAQCQLNADGVTNKSALVLRPVGCCSKWCSRVIQHKTKSRASSFAHALLLSLGSHKATCWAVHSQSVDKPKDPLDLSKRLLNLGKWAKLSPTKLPTPQPKAFSGTTHMKNPHKDFNRRDALRLLSQACVVSAGGLVTTKLLAGKGDWQSTLGTALDLVPSDVTVAAAQFGGRNCVAVNLTAEAQARSLRNGGNAATFAALSAGFSDGSLEVDLAGVINGKGDPDARAFVGLAFHVGAQAKEFEAVYLRMANGSKNLPPPPAPRNVRAVQYIAHPDFHFDVSRNRFPGKYEAGAQIALNTWHTLRLDISGKKLRALVDGIEILTVDDLRLGGKSGGIGLWVDDGTTGYFSNLRIRPA
eukprot:gene23306-28294_t